jgi:hypothetical protein
MQRRRRVSERVSSEWAAAIFSFYVCIKCVYSLGAPKWVWVCAREYFSTALLDKAGAESDAIYATTARCTPCISDGNLSIHTQDKEICDLSYCAWYTAALASERVAAFLVVLRNFLPRLRWIKCDVCALKVEFIFLFMHEPLAWPAQR